MLPDSLRENPTAAALADLAAVGNFEFAELTIEVEPQNIRAALDRVRNTLGFNRLSTITGVDFYPAEPRFAVIYHACHLLRQLLRPRPFPSPCRR